MSDATPPPVPPAHRVLLPQPGRARQPESCSFQLTWRNGEAAIVVYTTTARCATLENVLHLLEAPRAIVASAVAFSPSVPPTCSSVADGGTPVDVYPEGTHYAAAVALCAVLPGR